MSRMPQVTGRELIRFLKSQGFLEDRSVGSHLTLWHEARKISVTVPMHTGCDIDRGLAVRIQKDAGSAWRIISVCGDRAETDAPEAWRGNNGSCSIQQFWPASRLLRERG